MAEESEISKRIDDVHRRLDDLRGDMNTRFGELRGDMNRWMGGVDTRFGELRGDMNRWMGGVDTRFGELRGDMNARFRTLTWLIMVWFSFLTLLTVLFKFLRF